MIYFSYKFPSLVHQIFFAISLIGIVSFFFGKLLKFDLDLEHTDFDEY